MLQASFQFMLQSIFQSALQDLRSGARGIVVEPKLAVVLVGIGNGTGVVSGNYVGLADNAIAVENTIAAASSIERPIGNERIFNMSNEHNCHVNILIQRQIYCQMERILKPF